ncbi:MAG: peptide deformylase [Bacteroidetes bacterium]|nr:peptide deformylase [Bacteroidota bacterium]
MALLPIYPYDARVLREETRDVVGPSPVLTGLIVNMFETMRVAGGIGLAANQVGEGSSLFVIDLRPMEGFEESSPLVMINPVITDMWGEEIGYEEGCLSVPNVREEVFRPEKLHIRYRDASYQEQELEADDFLARVIQHEYDHLRGVFFTDYLRGLRKRLVMPVLKKIRSGETEIDYPMATDVELVS